MSLKPTSMRPAPLLLVALVSCILTVQTSAAPIVIDGFTQPNTTTLILSDSFNSWGTETTTITGATDALGGNRELRVASPSGGSGLDLTDVSDNGSTSDPDIDLRIRADSGNTYTGQAEVFWGLGGALNQDFSSAGSPLQFVLTLEDIVAPSGDLPDAASLALTFISSSSGSATHSLPLLSGGVLSTQYTWNASDFTGIDFTDIDVIELLLDVQYTTSTSRQSDVVVSYSSLVAVPEPDTAQMALVGLFGIGVVACVRHHARRQSVTA
jgi:hypothetical protein